MHAVKLIRPDGTEKKLNRNLNLAEAQALVGGLIEFTRSNVEGLELVVNEDGIYLSLPRNEAAQKLLHPQFDWSKIPGHEDFCLLGNVIVVKREEEEE